MPANSKRLWIHAMAFVLGAAMLDGTGNRLRAAELPRVPAGFEVELVAGPPLVERPVMACFDDHGRLYLVDSAGVNLRFNELVKDPPHSITVLDDTDGDGRFDRRTVFADKLVMPQGVLPYRGAVYVASPPSVWKLEDTDGDGTADKRTEIVTEFGSNGNAADIHGPFLGPDGWLYLCDGRHGHKVTLADGTVDQGLAGGIFRFRTDGSGFERVCGGGFDNPVEVDFTPAGEMLGTVNILHGNPRMDCLMYWIDGGAYPRADQEQCLAEFRRTGDLLPPIGELGHVAVSGMNCYRSAAFGAEYQHNVFMTYFNRHKVIRSQIERVGATFRSREEDFLTSDDPDFHPTDVLEDADGTLLVINTGGWFRIGCPTSQIAKPDVFGAIYRIRKTGTPPAADPRGMKLARESLPLAALANLLGDQRPAVREWAIERLALAGDAGLASVVPALAKAETSPLAKLSALSLLTRQWTAISNPAWLGSRPRAELTAIAAADRKRAEAIAVLLRDPSEEVRIAAARAAGVTANEVAFSTLLELVRQDRPAVAREAATAVGRIYARGHALEDAELRTATLAALFSVIRTGPPDRYLEHAALYAAIRMADRAATIPFLSNESPLVRRAALIVLDQMEGGGLTRELVTPLLETDDAGLQRAALDVIGRRADWGAATLGLLTKWLGEAQPTPERVQMLRGVLLAQSGDKTIQQLVADLLGGGATSPAVRALLWEVMHRSTLETLPESWLAAMGQALTDGAPGGRIEAEQREVIGIVRDRGLERYDALLRKLVDNRAHAAELRIEALAALAPRLERVEDPEFALLQQQLTADVLPLDRLTAARALSEAPLSEQQLLKLAEQLDKAGALATPVLLRAFARSNVEKVGLALVSALGRSPSAATLSPDEVAGLLGKYPKSVQEAGRPLLVSLGADLEKQRLRLDELSPALTGGDPAGGRGVFFSQKAACGSCHVIGNLGTRIGPDLTKVGASRSARDLLEAIAFPSASFVREFRPYTIVTERGKVYSGIVSRQTADALYLRTAQLTEIRIARSEIEELGESSTSIMPAGLDRQLTAQELRDLLAYLQSLK